MGNVSLDTPSHHPYCGLNGDEAGERYISVRHLTRGFIPNPPKVVAVLYAYLDETGISGADADKATIVGGLVGLEDEWVNLEGPWSARVKDDNISGFHASKCRGGHGEYHSWRPDWARMERHYTDLAVIAGGFDLRPVSGSVLLADWERLDDPALKQRYPSAYAFCFEVCLAFIQSVARDLNETAVVIYSINDQYVARANEVAQAHINSLGRSERIVSCVPARPEEVTPLQTADMAAYEMYHLFHSPKSPDRPELELMQHIGCSEKCSGFFYDYEALLGLSRRGPSGFF